MLHMAGGGRISRVHAPFVSDAEVEKVVAFLKQQGTPQYIEDVTVDDEEDGGKCRGTLRDPTHLRELLAAACAAREHRDDEDQGAGDDRRHF